MEKSNHEVMHTFRNLYKNELSMMRDIEYYMSCLTVKRTFNMVYDLKGLLSLKKRYYQMETRIATCIVAYREIEHLFDTIDGAGIERWIQGCIRGIVDINTILEGEYERLVSLHDNWVSVNQQACQDAFETIEKCRDRETLEAYRDSTRALDKVSLFMESKARQLKPLICFKTDLAAAAGVDYSLLYDRCELMREQLENECKRVKSLWYEKEANLLVVKLENDQEKCLLSRESLESRVHVTQHVCFTIMAINEQVHYRTLSKLSLLCKETYHIVFETMKDRLNMYGGVFKPSLISESWSLTQPIELMHIKELKKRKKQCVIVGEKITYSAIRDRCIKEVRRSGADMNDCEIQLHMTHKNRLALQAFSTPIEVWNVIYAIQTIYHHIYVEFADCHEQRSSYIFEHYGNNTCSVVFKMDKEDAYYELSFLIRNTPKKKG